MPLFLVYFIFCCSTFIRLGDLEVGEVYFPLLVGCEVMLELPCGAADLRCFK
jgi:hypothetical protein